jgi:hypothetical protein
MKTSQMIAVTLFMVVLLPNAVLAVEPFGRFMIVAATCPTEEDAAATTPKFCILKLDTLTGETWRYRIATGTASASAASLWGEGWDSITLYDPLVCPPKESPFSKNCTRVSQLRQKLQDSK